MLVGSDKQQWLLFVVGLFCHELDGIGVFALLDVALFVKEVLDHF